MGKKFVGLDGLKHFWKQAKIWIGGRITGEVTARIAEVVADAPEDLDTLKEIADWISTHADSASEMNTQINTNKNDIAALQTSVAGKAAASHTHTKSEITDFPTSLPADKIEPNYTSVTLTTVTSTTIKYIKVADCAWNQTGTLQVLLRGDKFEDTLVIKFGGGNAQTPMLCGCYNGNSHGVYSVIAKKGSDWNLGYSIYVKVMQLVTCIVNVALLTGDCTIDISETTTAPTNISEWSVGYGLFGTLTGSASTAGTADSATTAGTATTAAKLGRNGNTGIPMTFNWSGQDGQPSWLWGGNDGSNMYVYNPSNFSVNRASTAGTADKVASAGASTMWIYGRAEAICKTTSAGTDGGWKTLASIKTSSGSIEIGNLSGEDFIRIVYSSDADVNAGNNNVTQLLYITRGNIETPHEFIAYSSKALGKMVIPIGAPSSLEDGCIWIER